MAERSRQSLKFFLTSSKMDVATSLKWQKNWMSNRWRTTSLYGSRTCIGWSRSTEALHRAMLLGDAMLSPASSVKQS